MNVSNVRCNVNRRDFLVRTGLTLGSAVLAANLPLLQANTDSTRPPRFESWESVREQFLLSPDLIHMAGFFLASHPASVG